MPKIIELEEGFFIYQCPACDESHFFQVAPRLPAWQWNSDFEKPSVSPSVKVSGGAAGANHVCHFFITDGKISYCQDSTHYFAGASVEIPDWNAADQTIL